MPRLSFLPKIDWNVWRRFNWTVRKSRQTNHIKFWSYNVNQLIEYAETSIRKWNIPLYVPRKYVKDPFQKVETYIRQRRMCTIVLCWISLGTDSTAVRFCSAHHLFVCLMLNSPCPCLVPNSYLKFHYAKKKDSHHIKIPIHA
jgi:hypothetical protein